MDKHELFVHKNCKHCTDQGGTVQLEALVEADPELKFHSDKRMYIQKFYLTLSWAGWEGKFAFAPTPALNPLLERAARSYNFAQ